MKSMPQRQQGATLLVSLIMLVLMTLLVVSSFNMGKTNLQVVGNMQQRNQALSSAQEAIYDAISSTRFIESPTAVLSNNTNTMTVDANGDGTADITVVVSVPVCIKSQILKSKQLNVANPEDAGCTMGMGQNWGVQGSTTGNSLCAEGLWEISAVATDDITEATYSVTQGVGLRVSNDQIETACP